MVFIVDRVPRRERALCAAALLLVLLPACGDDRFTAEPSPLALAGVSGQSETPQSGASASASAHAGSGGRGEGGSVAAFAGSATTAGAGSAESGGSPGGGSAGTAYCLDDWRGSSCDKCAAITDTYDHAMCESVVDCCATMHLDCTTACNLCGCGEQYNNVASEVYMCRCGAK